MRSLQSYFESYGSHHRNPVNIAFHWVCVPTIFFCVIGLLGSIPPLELPWIGRMPWAKLTIAVVVLGFFLPRSAPMSLAMAAWGALCVRLAGYLDAHAPWPLWAICLVLFTAAWIGQFYGHKVEGRKPRFLEDLTFLLIGPAWLMAKAMHALGLRS